MKNFDSRAYCISDFEEWFNNGLLVLSPDFQRREVWSEKAKSYLIDTIINGKPIPKIIINQLFKDKRTIRVVVDGQQRLRAILEFMNGDFKISRAHNEELAGFTFDRLEKEKQDDFRQYVLGVDVIYNIEYEDILDIFTRINSYTVSLIKEEIFNAKYLGYFKQYAFNYGKKYVKYYIEGNIYTKANVTRMAEAEMAADCFIAIMDAVQTNKVVDQFYKKYEDVIGTLKEAGNKFDKIMSYIGEIYPPEQISNTNWSRKHLFYTLFTAIGHLLFGLNGLDPNNRFSISPKFIGKMRVQLDEISSRYDIIADDINNPDHPKDYMKFINWSRRGTTDTSARVGRANFVCKQIKRALEDAED